jgi:TRAP-type C4-dicarboxylate transport system permease small subunit
VIPANDRRAPPAMLAALLTAIDLGCAAGAAIAALCALALAAVLVAEVVLTSFAAWSQPWAVEYSIYLQAVIMFGGAGWALRNGGHIRVMMLNQALPLAARRAADMLVTAFALGVVGFAALALVMQATRTFNLGSVSFYPMQTPVWIPQAALAAAFVLFALALLARLIRLAIGQPEEVASTVGGTIE